jgi:hypothetical protein
MTEALVYTIQRCGWMVLMAMALCAPLVGCGGGEVATTSTEVTEDQMAVGSLPSLAADKSNDLARLREVFVKDAWPSSSDRKKYADHMFDIDGDITVTGDTATFPIKITNYETQASSTATWKAQKVDGTWLLSDAPVK